MMPPPPVVAAAPKAPNDMSGEWGFGLGVEAGANALVKPNATISVKYWISDSVAIMPELMFGVGKKKNIDTNWRVAPGALVLFSPWKSTSTRLNLGAGLRLSIAKGSADLGPPPPDATIDVMLPIYAGVEHFFTKWFSMGIAVQNDLVSYSKTGSAWTVGGGFDSSSSTQAVGFLFFYTD
jgi:hypothetical protein